MKWLDDLVPGETIELGTYRFTAEEIVAFARAFDPQPVHVDEAAARASHFGSLVASGWHVACAWMRLWTAHEAAEAAAIRARGEEPAITGPSPGFDDLQWLKPVVAGTTLTYRTTVVAARPTASRPGWGVVTCLTTADDETGCEAFRFTCHAFVPTRPAS